MYRGESAQDIVRTRKDIFEWINEIMEEVNGSVCEEAGNVVGEGTGEESSLDYKCFGDLANSEAPCDVETACPHDVCLCNQEDPQEGDGE